MKVKVFASLRDAAGAGVVDIAGVSVGELLREAHARFGDVVSHCTVLVNGEKVTAPDTPIGEGDEVAILPPVAGGQR